MWQFMIVAAVAGSTGFFARHLRKRVEKCGEGHVEQVVSGSDQAGMCDSVETQLSTPTKEEGIFRFSSPESGPRSGARKKGGVRTNQRVGSEQKLGSIGAVQRKAVKRFSVCLKRRRIGKSSAADKRPSEGSSSLFGWGLGVGIMYMMSAGKSEISKLNTAMDETAKAIEELKADLTKRQSSSSVQISRSAGEVKINTEKSSSGHTPMEPSELGTENRKPNDINLSSLSAVDDVDCPSSVLTEEQEEPELLEMDQLEAEFVSELQKLPWCNTEASEPDSMRKNLHEFDEVDDMENQMGYQVSDPYQVHGVKPSELDKKLSHLLIERQESQIIELESELQTAQLKLNAKEAELQALKDCVRHMTELSLSTITDDETEARDGVGCTDILDYNNMAGSESKRSVVGMKRSIDSELCGY